jgi:hypothetical protein
VDEVATALKRWKRAADRSHPGGAEAATSNARPGRLNSPTAAVQTVVDLETVELGGGGHRARTRVNRGPGDFDTQYQVSLLFYLLFRSVNLSEP